MKVFALALIGAIGFSGALSAQGCPKGAMCGTEIDSGNGYRSGDAGARLSRSILDATINGCHVKVSGEPTEVTMTGDCRMTLSND